MKDSKTFDKATLIERWHKRQANIGPLWKRPFHFAEWLSARTARWLRHRPFFDVLERLGKLTVLVAVISWLVGIPARKEEAEDQRRTMILGAWQVINSAHGSSGSGGRQIAMYDLASADRSLQGIDISRANFSHLELPGKGDLSKSNLRNTVLNFSYLTGVKLQRVDAREAQFFNSELHNASLRGGNFSGANFFGTSLYNADLSRLPLLEFQTSNGRTLERTVFEPTVMNEAILDRAQLKNADLTHVQFEGASLQYANLSGADVENANFHEADLRNSNLSNLQNWEKISDLRNAILYEVENPPNGFIEWAANEMGARIERPLPQPIPSFEEQ